MKSTGFTLIELVVVILVTGILAAAVAPRFFNRTTFDTRGFYDQAAAALRYGQKEAVAMRRPVCVSLSATAVSFSYGQKASCDTPLPAPSGGALVVSAPAGVSLASPRASFLFDALGRPSFSGQLDITVNGDTVSHIYVEQETGYVHP